MRRQPARHVAGAPEVLLTLGPGEPGRGKPLPERVPVDVLAIDAPAHQRLVNLGKHDYRLEPNLHFTLDMKHLIFRSNMHGEVHTYMVDLDKTGS